MRKPPRASNERPMWVLAESHVLERRLVQRLAMLVHTRVVQADHVGVLLALCNASPHLHKRWVRCRADVRTEEVIFEISERRAHCSLTTAPPWEGSGGLFAVLPGIVKIRNQTHGGGGGGGGAAGKGGGRGGAGGAKAEEAEARGDAAEVVEAEEVAAAVAGRARRSSRARRNAGRP